MPTRALAAFHDFEPALESFHDAVLEGLSRTPKTLPCKFLYDEDGSRLFEEICHLDEYYPTRTETALLNRHASEMADILGPECHLIEFGSGASAKVRILLEALERPRGYVPIDISRDHLIGAAAALAQDFPHLPVVAICADYTESLAFPDLGPGRPVGFFPGSTIGNFAPRESVGFLRRIAKWLDGLIIGVDLKKDPEVLEAAYDDAAGVTAAFNLNLLRRINGELGGTFDPDGFIHQARVVEGKVEMHLVSQRDQLVRACGSVFSFSRGETIHTENSHKYTVGEFHEMARGGGFKPRHTWVDPEGLFSIHYLEAL